MIPYELLITAVSDRADLFQLSVDSMLRNLDQAPARVVVHEDVRPGTQSGEIHRCLAELKAAGRIAEYALQVTSPARGMGPAILWVLREAQTQTVLYTQEDWLATRPVPVRSAMDLMRRFGLYHVRFNKRKTMPSKHADTPHPWLKLQVEYGGQTLCVSDHWYTQTSLWMRDIAMPGVEAVAETHPQSNAFAAKFNGWMNRRFGDGRAWNDQHMRDQLLRTYIWGGVGEPAYVKHIGSERGTGVIQNHLTHKEKRA